MDNQRYWQVELKDGTIINENEMEWRKVPKRAITRLSLFFDGRKWDLEGREAYFIKTRCSMVPGIQESLRIERRTIGYYQGAEKICYHIDESTGAFNMEVINTNE